VSDAAPAVERWLAWRYLATRQREGFVSFIAIFSLIGVALGVATLIVVLSVMGGFRQQLLGRIIGMNGHIVITARDGMVQATPELLAKLRDFPGVRTVRLTLERQALVAANGQTRGASLRGVRPEDLTSREIVTRNIVHGDLEGFVDMLAADVVAYGDGGGKAPAFPRPVHGRDKVIAPDTSPRVRLLAVLAADAVGYSRLMSLDDRAI
jgi:lipoprotein-releasing system permease protein